MSELTRRQIVAGTIAAAMAVKLGDARAAAKIEVLKATKGQGAPLTRALLHRRSVRDYENRDVPRPVLAELLWAANGINRPGTGGRTAPSWYASYGADVYVADKTGVWLYNAKLEQLERVIEADIRGKVSPEPFVSRAPLVILHISDVSRMHKDGTTEQDRVTFSYVDSAIISQNIYLFCAAAGLGTCLVGGVDGKAVMDALGLKENALVTYVQPVGYPKTV